MDIFERPLLRALIGYIAPDGSDAELVRFVTLDQAIALRQVLKATEERFPGMHQRFYVLVDPADERDLAMWHIAQRAMGNDPAA